MTRLLTLLTLACTARADELPITAAAGERQEAVRSAEVTFRLERVIEAGADYTIVGRDGVVKRSPETRVVGASDNRFLLDDSKVRSELTASMPHVPAGGRRDVMAYDGESQRQYWCPLVGKVSPHTGYGHLDSPRTRSFLPGEMTPLAFAFRGLDEGVCSLALTPKKWNRVGTRTNLFGDVMDEYEFRGGPTKDRLRVWTDPTRGHVVVCYGTGTGKPDSHQVDISYQFRADVGLWLPSGWTLTSLDRNGELHTAMTVTVTSIRLNQPIPSDEFKLTFPTGLLVRNEATGATSVAEPGGSLRPFALGGDKPTAPKRAQKEVSKKGLFLVFAVISLVILGALLVRLRSRRARTAPPGSPEQR
jgi:hypothetical protein